MISHRRPPRRHHLTALLLTATAVAAFYLGAVTLNHWPIIGAILLAGVAVALTLDTPEEPTVAWNKDDFKTYNQLIDQYETDGLAPDEAERAARDDIDWERR